MQRSKFAGSLVYPALSVLLFAATASAQSAPGTPAGSTTPDTAPPSSPQQTAPPQQAPAAPSDQAPAAPQDAAPSSAAPADTAPAAPPATDQQAPADSSSSQNLPPAPTEAQRLELARQAQARVRARRQQRIQAVEQDTYSHKYEVFGGYAFLRMRPGHVLQNFTETGWDAGVTRYFTNKLGATADARGYYGTAYVGNLQNIYNIYEPAVSNYSVSAGPSYRFYMKQKWSISGVAMIGIAHNLFYANSQNTPGTLVGLYPNQWRLSATVGVPIDYNLGPGLSIRLTPNYYLTNFGSEIQNNKSITAGINYRFGRR